MSFKITEHTIRTQFLREYPRATTTEPTPLSLVVKQYTPSKQPNPSFQRVTIVACHGNGCPKELYEPLWEDLQIALQGQNLAIENIWIADSAHQGASGVLNEEKLGNDPSPFDHSRDLLHLINHFQTQMTLPILGFGHSMGATQILQTSLMHPRLFHGLVVIEPVLYNRAEGDVTSGPVYLAASRRDTWASKEALVEHLRKSKAYRSWDGRVLERWVEFGFRESEGEVVLKTSRDQQTFLLARPSRYFVDDAARVRAMAMERETGDLQEVDYMVLEQVESSPLAHVEPFVVFHNLPFVRPAVLYMYGACSEFLREGGMRERAVRRTGIGVLGSGGVGAGRVTQVDIAGAGHMAPMEKPTSIAGDVAVWVGQEVQRWNEERRKVVMEWQGKEGVQRRMLDDEFLSYIGLKSKVQGKL